MRIEKLSVPTWNTKMDDHEKLLKKKRDGNLVLVCDEEGCRGEMEDQAHVDDTVHPFKRQVVCTECGNTDYRIE